MDIILKSQEITQIVKKCADWISQLPSSAPEIGIIGLRSRGVFLAQRIAEQLESSSGQQIPFGVLDVTLYRDDLDDPRSQQQPIVRSSEIDFDITGKTIILVDDVLYTGRTIRAAMDALMEFGRPKAIKLAVLVDRGGRELPIQPDFIGHSIQIADDMIVNVSFTESDDIDQVVVE